MPHRVYVMSRLVLYWWVHVNDIRWYNANIYVRLCFRYTTLQFETWVYRPSQRRVDKYTGWLKL